LPEPITIPPAEANETATPPVEFYSATRMHAGPAVANGLPQRGRSMAMPLSAFAVSWRSWEVGGRRSTFIRPEFRSSVQSNLVGSFAREN
jgi:hypothetical protein